MNRDGINTWEVPHPLQLNHTKNQGYVFGEEIATLSSHPQESGTWTPQLRTNLSTNQPDYFYRRASYNRNGNVIQFSLALKAKNLVSDADSDYLEIYGLPYPARLDASVTQHDHVTVWRYYGLDIPDNYWVVATVSRDKIILRRTTFNNSLWTIPPSALSPNSNYISISGSYAI